MHYLDLDLSGKVVKTGAYASLPSGVTVASSNWDSQYPAIDGSGALYQFADLGADSVIVRRPMTGVSTIVYRQSQWSPNHPHQVSPTYLVSVR